MKGMQSFLVTGRFVAPQKEGNFNQGRKQANSTRTHILERSPVKNLARCAMAIFRIKGSFAGELILDTTAVARAMVQRLKRGRVLMYFVGCFACQQGVVFCRNWGRGGN